MQLIFLETETLVFFRDRWNKLCLSPFGARELGTYSTYSMQRHDACRSVTQCTVQYVQRDFQPYGLGDPINWLFPPMGPKAATFLGIASVNPHDPYSTYCTGWQGQPYAHLDLFRGFIRGCVADSSGGSRLVSSRLVLSLFLLLFFYRLRYLPRFVLFSDLFRFTTTWLTKTCCYAAAGVVDPVAITMRVHGEWELVVTCPTWYLLRVCWWYLRRHQWAGIVAIWGSPEASHCSKVCLFGLRWVVLIIWQNETASGTKPTSSYTTAGPLIYFANCTHSFLFVRNIFFLDF